MDNMKKSLLLLITILASVGCFGQKDASAKVPPPPPPLKTTVRFVTPNEWVKGVRRFINAVRKGKEEVAKLVDYPLIRKYPIPSIDTKEEFLMRYNEIFDDKFVSMIINSDPYNDDGWSQVGDRGTMFKSGALWLDYGYGGNYDRLSYVNYMSKAEQDIWDMLLEADKRSLHESVRNFSEPLLKLTTDKFKIRIDILDDGNLRYASWPIDNDTSEKPDLVIEDGKRTWEIQGIGRSSTGDNFYFVNNGLLYFLCMGWHSDDDGLGWLEVLKIDEDLQEQFLSIDIYWDWDEDKTEYILKEKFTSLEGGTF